MEFEITIAQFTT